MRKKVIRLSGGQETAGALPAYPTNLIHHVVEGVHGIALAVPANLAPMPLVEAQARNRINGYRPEDARGVSTSSIFNIRQKSNSMDVRLSSGK